MKSEPPRLPLHTRYTRILFAIAIILLLAGCTSSPVPRAIGTVPKQSISVAQVQQQPDRFLKRQVRWGGTILRVRNRKQTTEIEVLSRPLGARGRPQEKEPGTGRFIALLAGFIDPAEYPEQRSLTVTGYPKRAETRPIGEYPYSYPVVAVEQLHLWPQPPPPRASYFHSDPWYHPWYYPWHHPWPYSRHYFRRPWYW